MKNESISVFVATHKPVTVALPTPYIPVQVNCANTNDHWPEYEYDDQGENISNKNPSYCELTVMYWAWKNSNARIKGLVHYRRFLSKRDDVSFLAREYSDLNHLEDAILTEKDIVHYLDDEGYDALVIMPQRPFPLTGREELGKFVYLQDIKTMEEIVHNDYPQYETALRKTLASKHMSHFNMIITHAQYFDGYCEWLFDILQKIEDATDVSGYDTQHKRLYGYLSEILQNVYIEKHGLRCKYFVLSQPYQTMGVQVGAYRRLQRKESFFKALRDTHFPYLEIAYYRIVHPDLYRQFRECIRYIKEQEIQT